MKTIRKTLLLMLVGLVVGCASSPMKVFEKTPDGQQSLSAGIDAYHEGSYADATKRLQNALDQGLNSGDQAKAHKYLAFIHCVNGRERQCREEFRKALEINPNMELDPAEAGHPLWGPVFRSVKKNPVTKKS